MAARCFLYYITDRNAFPGDESSRCRRLLEKISEATRAGVDYIQLREKDLPTRKLESLARQAASVVKEARQLAPSPRPLEQFHTYYVPFTECHPDRSLPFPKGMAGGVEGPAVPFLGYTNSEKALAPALLINSRTDVALAAGANGVHLRSDDISPQEVRTIWNRKGGDAPRLADFARRGSAGLSSDPLIGASCHSPEEVRQAKENGATFAVFAPVFEKKDAPGTRPAGLALLGEACRVEIPVLALGGITLANAQSCFDAGASGIAAIRLFQENNIAEIVRRLCHES